MEDLLPNIPGADGCNRLFSKQEAVGIELFVDGKREVATS